MSQRVDITGQKIGRWTVLALANSVTTGGKAMWLCQCACGTEREVCGQNIRTGKSISCGCHQRERAAEALRRTSTRHGRTLIPEYRIWKAMLHRCYTLTDSHYRLYGGRGITVCERWRSSFEVFLADMGSRPSWQTHNGKTLTWESRGMSMATLIANRLPCSRSKPASTSTAG